MHVMHPISPDDGVRRELTEESSAEQWVAWIQEQSSPTAGLEVLRRLLKQQTPPPGLQPEEEGVTANPTPVVRGAEETGGRRGRKDKDDPQT